MSKKKKSKKAKKVDNKDTQSKESKETKKSKKSGYKRGSLGKAIYAYFDDVGVDNAEYDVALKIAQKTLATTKFDKYHFSWYKNKYRQNQP